MSLSGTFTVINVDNAWEERVFEFLETRYQMPLTWTLDIKVAPPDPFYERPPRGVRAKLQWIWACGRYAVLREIDRLGVERWQLEGVEIFRAQFRFPHKAET